MKISAVEKKSIAEEVGLKAGDDIISICGKKCVDVLDYENCLALSCVTLEAERQGTITEYEIEKEEYEDLGLSFEEFTIRQCRNKCIFCFVDQLPSNENIRPSLRIKDDDYRMSFISGTYITLTNLSDKDIDRILSLHLSPLYISVHSTDDVIRKYMLGVKDTPPIMPILQKLFDGGIKIHAQIVYCPEINEDYENSFKDLSPLVSTLAVVPVGLTKNCNPVLKEVDEFSATKVIKAVERFQKLNLEKYGNRKIYASDEFYIKANYPIPDYETYEEFEQIENGVGLIAQFNHDFEEAFTTAEGKALNVSIATGVSAYDFIKAAADKINEKFDGKIKVYKIINEFFGATVTVAGLTVGSDIARELQGKYLGDELIITRTMLKEFGDCFLDNMTIEELQEKLRVKVRAISPTGDAFVHALVKEKV